MTETKIFLFGIVASVLCVIFLFVTLNELRKIGQGLGAPSTDDKDVRR